MGLCTHLEVELELHNMPQQLQEDVTEKIHTPISEQEHTHTSKSSTFFSEIQGEIEQFDPTKLTASPNIERKEAKLQESDTPVEENKEGMLLEDGVLLTYVLKKITRNMR